MSLQCKRQPPTTKKCPTPNVNRDIEQRKILLSEIVEPLNLFLYLRQKNKKQKTKNQSYPPGTHLEPSALFPFLSSGLEKTILRSCRSSLSIPHMGSSPSWAGIGKERLHLGRTHSDQWFSNWAAQHVHDISNILNIQNVYTQNSSWIDLGWGLGDFCL